MTVVLPAPPMPGAPPLAVSSEPAPPVVESLRSILDPQATPKAKSPIRLRVIRISMQTRYTDAMQSYRPACERPIEVRAEPSPGQREPLRRARSCRTLGRDGTEPQGNPSYRAAASRSRGAHNDRARRCFHIEYTPKRPPISCFRVLECAPVTRRVNWAGPSIPGNAWVRRWGASEDLRKRLGASLGRDPDRAATTRLVIASRPRTRGCDRYCHRITSEDARV